MSRLLLTGVVLLAMLSVQTEAFGSRWGFRCREFICMMRWCPFGFARDANGCKLCKCNPNPKCPEVDCFGSDCTFGVDIDGCRYCKCKPPATTTTVAPTRFTPRCGGLTCVHVVQQDGSTICKCKPLTMPPRQR